MNTKPQKLLEYNRSGLVEEEHFGFIKILLQNNEISIGEDNNYPFFLRSCAKPLQASLLCDYGIDKELSDKQIAVCCASHAGEKCHTDVISSILEKYNISENLLQCGVHLPLSQTAREELLKNNLPAKQIHNNCSGKHTMMLLISKIKGWDVKTYPELFHPLQQEIKKKIVELCETKNDYPVTKDGCGVPIFSMPLINILKGYMNLFFNDKYKSIKNAFANNAYLIGGENRLDTAIMTKNSHLIAKVGAGGLCTVVNTETKEGFIVKISDCNERARAVCVINILQSLGWIKNYTQVLNSQNQKDILILSGERIGQIDIQYKLEI